MKESGAQEHTAAPSPLGTSSHSSLCIPRRTAMAPVLTCLLGWFLLWPDQPKKFLDVFDCCRVIAASAAAATTTMKPPQLLKVLCFMGFSYFIPTMVATSVPPNSRPQNIFLMAGQSNMVGHGGIKKGTNGGEYWDGIVPQQCEPYPGIFRLDADLLWSQTREPIHSKIFPRMTLTGIGPGMPFARHILETHPHFGTIGLVPCAYDWTGIEEWSRNFIPKPDYTGPLLYNTLMKRANASIRAGGKIAALLWWQGGKDALHKLTAEHYKERLQQFFIDVRAGLAMHNLPIIMIIIPRREADFSDIVRDAQNSTDLTNLVKIDPPAEILEFEYDGLHITSDSQVKVGQMVAEKYCSAGYCT